MQSLYSYVVAFDSGFAPNPFYGFCSLATCKPPIRKTAQIGDWIIGTGSANKKINRGGCLVHAMQVSETLTTSEYWTDERFENKKPDLFSSWKRASGDNIYEPLIDGSWKQLNSYHSNKDGTSRVDHIAKDTSVERVLISTNYVYFGGEGPKLPDIFQPNGTSSVVKVGIGYYRKRDRELIRNFERWFNNLNQTGFQGEPWDWLKHYEKQHA